MRLKKFNEMNKFDYINCVKTPETHKFLTEYLDVIDLESFLNNENLHQICVYDKGKLIGVSVFRMKDGKTHMNYTAIDDHYRRMGINSKIKQMVIDISKANGCSLITANVRESNKASINSLLKSGFKINTNADLHYPDGEKKIPLYMRF